MRGQGVSCSPREVHRHIQAHVVPTDQNDVQLFGVHQVVAYNKMDLPDSADYYQDIRESLVQSRDVAPDNCIAISATTGQGTQQLVRRLHVMLDALPPQVWWCVVGLQLLFVGNGYGLAVTLTTIGL